MYKPTFSRKIGRLKIFLQCNNIFSDPIGGIRDEAYSTGSAQTMAWVAQYASGHSADTGYGLGLDASESKKISAVMKASEDIA